MSFGKNKSPIFFKSMKILVASAFLAAMSIVFGKYLAIPIGEFMRFSFENTPIILAGITFGPLAGCAVGAVADLVGCVAVGYTINPLVTVGAASIGLISGSVALILEKIFEASLNAKILFSTIFAHIVGSLIIKTVGLHIYYPIGIEILFLWRLLNYAVVGTLDTIVLYFLLKNKTFRSAINSIKN